MKIVGRCLEILFGHGAFLQYYVHGTTFGAGSCSSSQCNLPPAFEVVPRVTSDETFSCRHMPSYSTCLAVPERCRVPTTYCNMSTRLIVLVAVVVLDRAAAFVSHQQSPRFVVNRLVIPRTRAAQDGAWTGDVVSNTQDGKIQGCTIQNVGESITEWIIYIDG
jgi:hypothetical protein